MTYPKWCIVQQNELQANQWASYYQSLDNYNEGNGIEKYTTLDNGDVIIPIIESSRLKHDYAWVISDPNIEKPRVKCIIKMDAKNADEHALAYGYIKEGATDEESIGTAIEIVENFLGEEVFTIYNIRGNKEYGGIARRFSSGTGSTEDNEYSEGLQDRRGSNPESKRRSVNT